MELKIYIRQTQFQAIENDPVTGIQAGQNIVFVGTNTATLHPIPGNVPKNQWWDITQYVGNIDRIQLTWTSERDSSGNLTTSQLNPQRAASNSIQIEDAAYSFIKEWLINDIAAPINAIDVRITHVGCGTYEDFQIKSTQINWCEDEKLCEFDITVRQKDEYYHCIQKTLIEDNWQGWFPESGKGGKKHPRFLYCNEIRPNMMMIGLWWISTIIFTIVYLLTPIINTIIAIIGVIMSIIDAISWLFGGNPNFDDNFNWFNPGDIARSFYVETSGCGRMYPAPLIRDYIYNVCKKCDVQVDGVSAPAFFSRTMDIETSADRKLKRRDNPYYNACYLAPQGVRGIRVFEHLFGSNRDLETYWIDSNSPLLSLDMFLDELKGIFNSEWRITNVNGKPTLFFWRKDWFVNGKFLYDFTKTEDRLKILQGMCFSWNDIKMPTYIQGIYAQDPQDACGNEAAKKYMNDMVSIANKTNNIGFDGVMDKTNQYFGGTRFRLDGVSRDYIADGMQVIMNGAILTPTIPAILKEIIIPAMEEYGDYSLLLSDECSGLGKILIWDENTGVDYAKVIKTKKTADTSISTLPLPEPNPHYNPNYDSWTYHHPPETKVTGSNLSPGPEPLGQYQVKATPFSTVLYNKPALLCNYPMFFQAYYRDNLWDWFHWIDDPNINPKMNLNWNVKIELCCDDLKKLGLFGNGSDVKLLNKVKIPNKYYSDGIITEITASYDSSDEVGKYIEIKGTL